MAELSWGWDFYSQVLLWCQFLIQEFWLVPQHIDPEMELSLFSEVPSLQPALPPRKCSWLHCRWRRGDRRMTLQKGRQLSKQHPLSWVLGCLSAILNWGFSSAFHPLPMSLRLSPQEFPSLPVWNTPNSFLASLRAGQSDKSSVA